jgi:lipooligosaccharide transport system permease protein
VALLADAAFSPHAAGRFWRRNLTVGRKTLLITLIPRFLEAIAYLLVMGLGLGAYVSSLNGVDYVRFIAPGVAGATVMFGAVLETTYNAFVRIHVRRVYEAAVTTPLSVQDVVVGEYLWATTRAIAYGTIFLAVMFAFGLVSSAWALLCIPVMLLGALVFAVFGMVYTAWVSNIESFNIFFTAVLTPMFLFGGVFFPFDKLPSWAQAIAWCLPLSNLVEVLRALTLGTVVPATLLHLLVLAAMALVLFPIPLIRMSRTLRR